MEIFSAIFRGVTSAGSWMGRNVGALFNRFVSIGKRSDGPGAVQKTGGGWKKKTDGFTPVKIETVSRTEKHALELLDMLPSMNFHEKYEDICAAVKEYGFSPVGRKRIVEEMVEQAEGQGRGLRVVYNTLLSDPELKEYVVMAMLNHDAHHGTNYSDEYWRHDLQGYTLPQEWVVCVPPKTREFIMQRGWGYLLEVPSSDQWNESAR